MSAPRLLDAGETALVVEFGAIIDKAVNARVLALDAALARRMPDGVTETVPTYRSLMIHYDPLRLARNRLAAIVEERLADAAIAPVRGRRWSLPACYDPAFAVDAGRVAAATGLSPERVAGLHSGAIYDLCMYGFAPGWAYLGGLPRELALPRRTDPRDLIPAGSLIIAGGQAIVAAGAMPSGWHIIGRTPELLFAPGRDPVFLMAVGDTIGFDPVDRETFGALETRAAAGEILARAVPAR